MGKAPYEAGLPRSTSANSVVETRSRLQVTQVTQINTVEFLGVLGGVDHPFRHQLREDGDARITGEIITFPRPQPIFLTDRLPRQFIGPHVQGT
jgi:hypothetical protein